MKINWTHIIEFKWFKRLYVLYIFGFVVNFRPSTPFVFEFLTHFKHFPKSVVTGKIFPIVFYSTVIQSLPVFLLADFTGYNIFIIISSLTGIVTTCLLIWTSSLVTIQIAEVFYGSTVAAELAYFACIYGHGDIKNYQKLTAYIRATPLIAKTVASLIGQLLISQNLFNYEQLHYFDLAAFIIATIISIFIPPIKENVYLQKNAESGKFQRKISLIFTNFTRSFPNKYVVKWTIWSIFTVCVYQQVTLYVEPLWMELRQNDSDIYNGVLEGVYCIFALMGTEFGGHASFDWKYKGDLILSMTSLMQAFMLIFMSQIENTVLNSIFYVIYGFMYHLITTAVYGEIAKFLNKGCFGLIFGFIAFAVGVLGSGMVCLLNDRVGFQFGSQDLFMTYGFFHLCLSVIFIIVGLGYWFAKHTYPI